LEGHDENIDEMKETGRDATLYVLKSFAKLISPITIDRLKAAWGGISRPWRGSKLAACVLQRLRVYTKYVWRVVVALPISLQKLNCVLSGDSGLYVINLWNLDKINL
jgi:hypothetical protein